MRYPTMILALLALCGCGTPSGSKPLAAVPALDLPRYMGHWYELAKYPNRFQAKCAGETTADYQLLEDGAIKVTNRCRRADGALDEAIGRAESAGPGPGAKLKVRFAPAWLSWLPFVWGDYWVIDLDPDYTLAAVSEPDRDYLWILSRTPAVDPARYQALLSRLRGAGFDLGKLVATPTG